MVDIGAGHITGKNHAIECDQINRGVVGLKVKSNRQRIGRRKVQERTIGIDGNLGTKSRQVRRIATVYGA